MSEIDEGDNTSHKRTLLTNEHETISLVSTKRKEEEDEILVLDSAGGFTAEKASSRRDLLMLAFAVSPMKGCDSDRFISQVGETTRQRLVRDRGQFAWQKP